MWNRGPSQSLFQSNSQPKHDWCPLTRAHEKLQIRSRLQPRQILYRERIAWPTWGYVNNVISNNFVYSNTRSASSNQFFITSFRTNLRRFCPTVIGTVFWNNVLQTVKGRTIRKLMGGGGGGKGDFQLARFYFFALCLCRNFFCRWNALHEFFF